MESSVVLTADGWLLCKKCGWMTEVGNGYIHDPNFQCPQCNKPAEVIRTEIVPKEVWLEVKDLLKNYKDLIEYNTIYFPSIREEEVKRINAILKDKKSDLS